MAITRNNLIQLKSQDKEKFKHLKSTDVVFTVDDDRLDMMLHNKYDNVLDYKTIDDAYFSDTYYILDKRNFDRFMDFADSSGYDVDYENSEDSVINIVENTSISLSVNEATELPEYFSNIVLGQYAMTGVPLKVYANNRYYVITSPDDIDDPLIGYGMMTSGKMEPFDYRDINHIMVSGNKVDLATYTKAMSDELAGAKKSSDSKSGEEKKEKGDDEKAASPFESFDPHAKKWSLKALYEISKDEYNAQEDALKAEMEAGKAKINAAKDKMNDLKKQPIDDGVIYEADEIKAKIAKLERDLADVKHKYYSTANLTPQKDMQLRKQMGQISIELKRARREDRTGASGYKGNPLKTVTESVISDILIIASESTTYEKFISELISQKLLKREDLKDPELVDELKTMYRGQALGKRESVNENHISEPYIIRVGDMVRNINPQCDHYGSTGIVNAIQALDGDIGNIVKYIVTNFGDTFKPGMALMKTPDQLEPLK